MSQTIADGLQGIINAKSNIDGAIEAKGGIVTKGLENSADDIMTIPNGEGPSYRSTVLWDYTTDNNGIIQYDPFIGTLHDSINNYDAIQLEVVSSSGDLDTSDWDSTMLSPIIPVYVLNNLLKNNYLGFTSFETRSCRWYIKDTIVQKTTTNIGETNGLVRLYGIKFYGGGGTVADEDALIELVDSGAKNLSEWAGGTTETDDSFVVQNEPITLKKGTYVISFDTTADSGSCEVVFSDANDNVGSHTFDNISSSTLSSEITLTADAIKFNLFTTKAATITNFMICTKAAWGVSHEYQPYRPSYQELYEQTETNENTISSILDGTTIDSFEDVETALSNKQNTIDSSHKLSAELVDNSTPVFATATQGVKADTAIQGIKVNSSTVNPDSNKVINITVPTSAADVSALPDTTKYAAALSLTINSSTFVVTGQLKDQNGDNLGTAQTIDLPLESVVVGGSYDSQTKKVVLTLQNGNTVEFSVADLVSGLQTELSTSNKLNPAFIEYDNTHRAVSDTEKSTWNSKQNALSSTQLDAVNSGINSTKVEQIETNKNNILSAYGGMVGKNLFDINNATESGKNRITAIIENDAITVTNTGNYSYVSYPLSLKAGTYRISATISDYEADEPSSCFIVVAQTSNASGTYLTSIPITGNGDVSAIFTINENKTVYITYCPMLSAASGTNTFKVANNMMMKNGDDTTYQPYIYSNAELTVKEQANESNISKQQDTTTQGGNGYAIINGVRQYTGDTVTSPVPPNSLWIKDSVKVKTDNYFNADDFSAIQVDAQGNLRCGTNCGILPQGTYTLSATTSAPQNPLFHTIKSGNTYTMVAIDSLPYTFTADGVSEQIIRVANATTTSWAENGYADIMLNTGSTAESYTQYWTDVIDEKIKPLENNISLVADQTTVYNYLSTPTTSVTYNQNTYTFTTDTDGNITASPTNSDTRPYLYQCAQYYTTLPAGAYYIIIDVSNAPETSGAQVTMLNDNDSAIATVVTYNRTGRLITQVTVPTGNYGILSKIYNGKMKIAIVEKSLYDAGFTDYQPYALSNVELTVKEQANENNISLLQEQVGYAISELEGVL